MTVIRTKGKVPLSTEIADAIWADGMEVGQVGNMIGFAMRKDDKPVAYVLMSYADARAIGQGIVDKLNELEPLDA